MSGPFFDNREDDPGLAQTVPRAFDVVGYPQLGGNVAADGHPIDSRLLASYIETARGLRQAIDGTETSGDLGDPASATGHKHEEAFDGGMPWQAIASWQLNTVVSTTLASELRLTCTHTASISYKKVLFVPFCVPIGITHVVPIFYVKHASGATGGSIKFDFYQFGSNTTPSVVGGELTTYDDASTSAVQQDLKISDTRGYDLSGIATTGSHRVVCLSVEIKSSDGNPFALNEVVIMPAQQGYRATPTRSNLDTSSAVSDAALTEQKLSDLFVDNPKVLRNATYGTTLQTPSRSTRHNHGEGRGEPLKRHHISVAFGPHTPEGAAYDAVLGIPVNEPDTGVSFVTAPKLLAVVPLHIPAQIASVTVYLAGFVDGVSFSYGIKAEIRPRGEAYSTPGYLNGQTQTFTLSAGSAGRVTASGSITTLYKLGDGGRDRLFELCLWQTTNPAATETYRLTGVTVHYQAFSATNDLYISEDLRQPALEQIPFAQIRTGQETSQALFARANRVWNQCAEEILGGVQGYASRMSYHDIAKPWKRRRVVEQHQHRGSYTDPISGELIDDGAIIRTPLICQTFIHNVSGDGTEGTTSDANPIKGALLHPSGTLNSTTDWFYTGGIFALPMGLGAIDIHALIQPVTSDPRGRLFCFASVVQCQKTFSTPSATQIATRISCADYEGNDNQSLKGSNATNDLMCEVLPEDSEPWITNSKRLGRGLGCWTRDALRQAVTDSNWQQTNAMRWTQPIRIEITPTTTGLMRLRVKWALQTGDYAAPDDGTYPTTPRILALIALPSRGY